MSEFYDWLVALDPAFAFLLALPFAVAAAGLCAEGFRRSRAGRAAKSGTRRYAAHAPRDTRVLN